MSNSYDYRKALGQTNDVGKLFLCIQPINMHI